MADNGNTTRTQLINLEGLSTFLDESKKIFEPTLPAGANGQVLKLSGGKPTWGTDNTPTTFKWTNGTTAGPTGSLTGDGMAAVSFGAIPSAGASASGVVTTGAQTFAGTKTFSSPITGSLNGNASTATSADKTAHSLSVKDGAATPAAAINSWNGSTDKTLTIKGESPVATTATDGTITITHDKKGPSTTAATSKGDTSNQAPGFGGTFKVTSATVDAYGHTTALADHTVTIPSRVASSEANGLMSSAHWSKLENIASGAEVNQNAFSNVKVGNTVVAADSKTDTLTLVAGSNVTITPDATNDKITIASSYVNTTYSAGTDLGLSGTTFNHANSGVTAGTYRSVTVNARGHVTGGTNPTTLSGYGITDAKIASGVITLGSNTITPLTSSSTLAAGKVSGTLATSNIPNLDASKITTGTISVDRLPATALERCVVVADDTARFKLTASSVQVGDTVKVTSTKKMYMVIDSSKLSSEAGYEEYFTSTDWSTITNKPSSYTPSSHTHTKSQITDFPTKMPASDVHPWAKAENKPSYAWSEITDKPSTFTPATHSHDSATQSANGFMSSADKKKLDGITESADSVSFSRSLTSGTKVGTITINGTGTDLYAPTNTDTHYTAKNVVASSNTGTANVTAATSNPYLNLIENGDVRSAHQIKGSGATTVKTDTSGNIVISSTDTNSHYTATPVLGATDAVANATSETSDPYLNIIENGGKSGGIQIKGSGATSVSAINGVLTISSTDNNTTNVSAATTGSGNAVTSVTASGSAITVTKGASFLTAHQDISGKEDKSNKVTAWSSTTTDEHYPSENLVKSALDTKVNTANVLTYEEIMDSTDLSGKVASASVLKTLSDNLSDFSVLKTSHAYGVNFNLDDLSNYPGGVGLLNYSLFSADTTGTKPFPDGHLLTFIWRNDGSSSGIYLSQIAIEDDAHAMKCRYYSQTVWSDWKSIWMEGDRITGAVFNDLADAIPVGEGDVLEAGYCYGFGGEHYAKTSEYMQKSYIGIHSDTYGFKMGHEKGKEKLNVAISGFVLAYVDKEYEVGTPLTCTVDGCLTEIKLEDKIKYPERVIATYWKSESNEEWGPEGDKIKVNGRKWVKVK